MLGARLESRRSRYEPGLRWVLSGSSHTSDLNMGIPVAPLPGAWCYRVSPGTGGRNSSAGSVWARCPQHRGFDPPLGTYSVEGIFPLELTWVQTPFPQKLLRMRL